MRFKPGYYIHEAAMDVFIEILKPQYQDEKRFKGRVRYWNLGFTGNPWVIGFNEPIEIQAKDFSKWRHFNPETEWKAFRERQRCG
jgi:hypothetical protein